MGTGFSFEVVDATAYDDLRPGYAREAVAWVVERGGLNTSSLVLDVAAGTGQLSRILVPLGFRCVAVEPAQNMRSILKQRVAGLPVVAATAEALPFPDAAVEALVVGNAFHHFDAEQAFEEARRVLRHGGVLALFWARAAPDAFDDPIIRRIRSQEQANQPFTHSGSVPLVVRPSATDTRVHAVRAPQVLSEPCHSLPEVYRPVRNVERHRGTPGPGTGGLTRRDEKPRRRTSGDP